MQANTRRGRTLFTLPGMAFKEKQNTILMSTDQVNHPQHYGGEHNPYEAIKVIEACNLDFHLGNTVKYVLRAGKKDDIVQDLEKAKWYLERKIQQIKAVRERKKSLEAAAEDLLKEATLLKETEERLSTHAAMLRR